MVDITNTQFEVLAQVAKGRASASEIATKTGISLPYILSQLTLMEAKGFINKDEEKKENKPGKPKKFYELTNSIIDVTLLMEGFGKQYQIQNPSQLVQVFFRALSFVPSTKQGAFAEYFWCKAKFFSDIKAIAIVEEKTNSVELLAITSRENLAKAREEISEHEVSIPENKGMHIACWVHTIEEILHGLHNHDEYYKRLMKLAKPLMDDENSFTHIYKEAGL